MVMSSTPPFTAVLSPILCYYFFTARKKCKGRVHGHDGSAATV
jgi:hypothetical protein